MRIRFSILFFLLCMLPVNLLAQGNVGKANEYFETGVLYKALPLYLEILDNDPEVPNAHLYKFRVAECYRMANDADKACQWYEKSLVAGYYDTTINLNYAKMLLMTGNSDKAKTVLMGILLSDRDNVVARLYMEQCTFSSFTRGSLFTLFKVQNEERLNTEWNEFGICPFNEGFLFTSSRIAGNRDGIYPVNGHAFEKLYYTLWEPRNQIWADPVVLKGPINSDFNTGTFVFDKSRNEALFMQCNGYKGDEVSCDIYRSIRDATGNEWTKPERLNLGPTDFSYGHPSLSSDGNTLYFVSDMDGGVGGKDIWQAKRLADGVWGEIHNLGEPVNSAADEMFPFLFRDSLLYFSSNGHKGYGGLDLFFTWIEMDEYIDPVNMNPPFNSQTDDFGICLLEQDSGFLISNRPDGFGGDDIYSFFQMNLSIYISGLIRDKNSGTPVGNAYVMLSRDDGFRDSTITDSSGYYSFYSIEPNYTYVVTADKKGYLSDRKNISTIGVLDSLDNTNTTKRYLLDLALDLDFQLIKITSDEIEIPDIYYDFNAWTLRDTSKIALSKLLILLNANPNLMILINSHTDERGKDEYNMVLSQKRAQSVVEYLVKQGIQQSRLQSKGWGESKLIRKSAQTEEDHQMNRRTTFTILNPEELNDLSKNVPVNIQSETKQAVVVQEYHFRVQVAASKNPVEPGHFSQLENEIGAMKVDESYSADGYYRYSVGPFTDYKEVNKYKSLISRKGYNAFIIAYKDGKIIDLSKALKNMRNEK
ncbi:MAG: OmpA family protein [Bacteroidetes bacterium]|nr:OmpA family protein [Bacteroidota bacterium]MBU1720176.1 OmpA family protein [Bacteroidota bacterium]